MTKTLTTDELRQIVETDHVQCGDAAAMARELLANREAQPVAEVLSSRSGNDTSTIDKALPAGTKVYIACPVPAVPDERKAFEVWLASDYSADGSGKTSEADEKAFQALLWHVWQARAVLAQPVSQGCKLVPVNHQNCPFCGRRQP